MTDGRGGSGGVLRLRNLAMIENIRRAEDPAWRERLEQQQVLARLGRMVGRAEDPLQTLQDHVQAVKEELQTRRSAWRTSPRTRTCGETVVTAMSVLRLDSTQVSVGAGSHQRNEESHRHVDSGMLLMQRQRM